jgi:hypothetical protein
VPVNIKNLGKKGKVVGKNISALIEKTKKNHEVHG